MKINFLKKEKNFEKKEFVFNTDFYWKIAVALELALIVLSVVFGYYLFRQTNQEVILPAVSESGQAPAIKAGSLEKVLNYFSEREQKSVQILNSSPPVVDPSW